MTSPTDPLAPLTAATRARLEEVFAGRVPDFAAMLARARELGPNLVSESTTAQAEALAPVIPLARAHRDRSDLDALAPFTAATRAVLTELTLAPPRLAPPPLVRPRRRLAALTAGLAALAALVLLWQGPRVANLLTPQTRGVEALAGSHDNPPQPLHAADPPHNSQTSAPTRSLAPTAQPVETISTQQSIDPIPTQQFIDPASTQFVDPTSAPLDTISTPARDPLDPRAAPRRPAPTDTPSLEDQAQALWQRGELTAAEQKFRAVVRLAGKTSRAELAYGDLFALAGQIRGPAGQTALAREYLAAFPAGRFADDMRAGLCQRLAAETRPTCWRDYLTKHPAGAHRSSAEAALTEPPQ